MVIKSQALNYIQFAMMTMMIMVKLLEIIEPQLWFFSETQVLTLVHIVFIKSRFTALEASLNFRAKNQR